MGRLGLTSPRSPVLCFATTAPYPSRVASLPLASQYLVCFLTLCSLWLVDARKLPINARALGHPVPLLFRECSQGDTGLSQVPELPLWCHAPLSSDPGGVPSTGHLADRTAAFHSRHGVGFGCSVCTEQLSFWSTTLLISGLADAAWHLASSGSVRLLRGLHAEFTTELLAKRCSDGTRVHNSHPLGNTDLFHEVILQFLDLGLRLARGATG